MAAGLRSEWLRSTAALFVMRMCMSINFNAIREIKITNYAWDSETQGCVYRPRSDGEPYSYYVPVYLVEFFLPALGGLLVDKWYGEVRVLMVSGVLMLLSSAYVTGVEYGQQICHPALYLLGLVPSCLAYGLGMAPLVAAPLKLSHGRFGSATPGLLIYYVSACTGEFLGLLPGYFRQQVNLTWIVCVSPVVYIAASATLQLDWTEYRRRVYDQLEDGFQFPTRTRLLRYFILLAPLVLMTTIVANVRGMTYCSEINYYLNCTGNCSRVTCGEVFSSYNAATLAVLLLLVCLYKAGCLAREGQMNARFYTGASILLVSKAALIPWHCWTAGRPSQPDEALVHWIYAGASGLDGLANGLALAAGYELMFRIAPACAKNLIMGFLMTMWAIGACIGGLTMVLFLNFPRGAPVMKPVFGQANNMHMAYVVMTIEAILLLLFYHIFSTRLAKPLILVEDTDVGGEGEDEADVHDADGVDADAAVGYHERVMNDASESSSLATGDTTHYRSFADA